MLIASAPDFCDAELDNLPRGELLDGAPAPVASTKSPDGDGLCRCGLGYDRVRRTG